VTVLLQPEHAAQAERHVRAAKAGIKWFGLWFGRYPYPTLTVVDPAFGASGSGGMEYPTFITAGSLSGEHRLVSATLDPEDRLVLASSTSSRCGRASSAGSCSPRPAWRSSA